MECLVVGMISSQTFLSSPSIQIKGQLIEGNGVQGYVEAAARRKWVVVVRTPSQSVGPNLR
jgi:hypothetical protein